MLRAASINLSSEEKESPAPMFAFLGVVLVVGGIVMYFLMHKHKHKDSSAAAPESETFAQACAARGGKVEHGAMCADMSADKAQSWAASVFCGPVFGPKTAHACTDLAKLTADERKEMLAMYKRLCATPTSAMCTNYVQKQLNVNGKTILSALL